MSVWLLSLVTGIFHVQKYILASFFHVLTYCTVGWRSRPRGCWEHRLADAPALKRKRLCLYAQEEAGESCETRQCLKLSVNSVTFSVCWVPTLTFCPEGFWVNSENCEYSEHMTLQTQYFLLSSKTSTECLYLLFFFLQILLVCLTKLHPEGRLSATQVWPAVLDISLGMKKGRICTLGFPLLKVLM